MKDYYKILQVNKSASPEIISKVYKLLAKKYHPDSNPDNIKEAEEKFKEISEAYEILSDEEKRKNYDLELEAEESHNSETVSYDEYMNLKNYCVELENTIEDFKNMYSGQTNQDYTNTSYTDNNAYTNNTYTNNNSNQARSNTSNYNTYATNQAAQRGYQDAVNKAYYDSYINNLKNMGYKIKYHQTFKQKFKNLLALLITAAIICILLYIFINVPSLNTWFRSLFILPI